MKTIASFHDVDVFCFSAEDSRSLKFSAPRSVSQTPLSIGAAPPSERRRNAHRRLATRARVWALRAAEVPAGAAARCCRPSRLSSSREEAWGSARHGYRPPSPRWRGSDWPTHAWRPAVQRLSGWFGDGGGPVIKPRPFYRKARVLSPKHGRSP